jgi:hypothetical protein
MSDKIKPYMEGMALFGEGKHADSIEKFQAALAIDPEWDDCLQALSQAQMHAGDLEGALVTAKGICEMPRRRNLGRACSPGNKSSRRTPTLRPPRTSM